MNKLKYLKFGKLPKLNSYLRLTPKNLIFFFVIYSILLFISNLILGLILQVNYEKFDLLKRSLLSLSLSLKPCDIASFKVGANYFCQADFGLILLYIYFATVSILLVFSRKLKFFHWMIGFIFFNLIAGVFIVLKAYLYLNI